jgi:hypothetical protein
MPGTRTPKVNLDWSRLLVFDQAPAIDVGAEAAARLIDPRLAKLGLKPVKTGMKPVGTGFHSPV